MAKKQEKARNDLGRVARPSPQFDAKAFLSTVGEGRSTRQYKPKATVFVQGDPADGVFFIQSGKIELNVVSPQGKQGVVAMLGAGDFCGEGCLAGQPLHMASAIAVADSVISKID